MGEGSAVTHHQERAPGPQGKGEDKKDGNDASYPLGSSWLYATWGQCRCEPAPRDKKHPPKKGLGHYQMLFNKYKGFPLQPSNWVLILKGLPGKHCANQKPHPLCSSPLAIYLIWTDVLWLHCYWQAWRVLHQDLPLLQTTSITGYLFYLLCCTFHWNHQNLQKPEIHVFQGLRSQNPRKWKV